MQNQVAFDLNTQFCCNKVSHDEIMYKKTTQKFRSLLFFTKKWTSNIILTKKCQKNSFVYLFFIFLAVFV